MSETGNLTARLIEIMSASMLGSRQPARTPTIRTDSLRTHLRTRGRVREGRKGEGRRERRERGREVRMWVRVALSRLKFESRRFLSRRNESPCTRAAKVPGSRAGTPSYYFYGPETSAGIIIISPGRGRARSSALLHRRCRRRRRRLLSRLLLPLLLLPTWPRSFLLVRSFAADLSPACPLLSHGDDDSRVNAL